MTAVAAKAYTRAGTLVANLAGSEARQWQDMLNDCGGGSLSLQNDDSDLALIDYGQIVRFSLGGTDRFAMLIEALDRTSITQAEEVDQATLISGRGTLAVLEEGVVQPASGAPTVSTQDARLFNFANPDLDDSGWASAVAGTFDGFPPGWKDFGAGWVWDRNPMVTGIPAGDVYFRKSFTTATTKSIEVWCVADDGYEIWLDGDKLFEDTLDGAWTGQAKHDHYNLPAGTHVVAVHARNNNTLLAGLRAAVIEIDAADSIISVLAHTDTSWKVLAYPSSPPGFTVGQILNLLLAEAQARGTLTDVAVDFSDTLDSAGNAWPDTWDVSLQVGADYLSVVKQLAETYMDVAMSVTGLTLSAWASRGTTRTVTLSAGSNLTELKHSGKA